MRLNIILFTMIFSIFHHVSTLQFVFHAILQSSRERDCRNETKGRKGKECESRIRDVRNILKRARQQR